MKTRCHRCLAEVSLTQTVCPQCGASLSLGTVLGVLMASLLAGLSSGWHRLWGGKDRTFTATCPRCGEPIPFSASECPCCRLEVRFAFLFAIQPLLNLLLYIHQLPRRASPFQRTAAIVCYSVASGALLWLLLLKAEAKFDGHSESWMVAALATAIYVAVSFILFPWLVSPTAMRLLASTRPLFKLSLFLNYIATALAVMLASDLWKTRSWLLITTFLVLVLGTYVFVNYLHPIWTTLGETLNPPPSWAQRSPAYRGRQAGYRPGKWS